MPLSIPKSGTPESLYNQLSTIEALDAEGYAELSKNATISKIQLVHWAINQAQFADCIGSAYDKVCQTKKEKKERIDMDLWQSEIKRDESLSTQILNLAGRKDFVKDLHNNLKTAYPAENLFEKIRRDAADLHRLLTPSLHITKTADQVSEHVINLDFLKANPPNIIFIMGNNDLRQIDAIGRIFAELKQHNPNRLPTIYVSGFGGHGTMHDAVFNLSEGATMVKRLIDLGIPANKILVEYDAVDTGRNVFYMDIFFTLFHALEKQHDLIALSLLEAADIPFLEKMFTLPAQQKRTGEEEKSLAAILKPIKKFLQKNNIVLHDHILISGTPGGLLRQTRTFEKQTSLPWHKISCLTPDEFLGDMSKNYYYQTPPPAQINFIYALREVASLLDYTLNYDYLADRALPDLPALQRAVEIYADYYNLMAKPIEKINGPDLATKFINYITEKPENLIQELKTPIQLSANYFRRAFLDVEHVWLKQLNLNCKYTPNEQAEKLDTGGTYTRLGLIPFFKNTKESKEINVHNSLEHLSLRNRK